MEKRNQPADETRREFLSKIAGVAGGVVLFAAFTGCEETIYKLPTAPEDNTGLTVQGNLALIDTGVGRFVVLQDVGGYAAIQAGALRLLVFRTGADAVSVLSRICTHNGCDLNPAGPNQATIQGDSIKCGCHGSVFRIGTGERTEGPAELPLKKFTASVSGPIISIRLN